ncbi:MAG: hypothetical protein ABFQ95_07435, partial [Pseudomonadota bacterium]
TPNVFNAKLDRLLDLHCLQSATGTFGGVSHKTPHKICPRIVSFYQSTLGNVHVCLHLLS